MKVKDFLKIVFRYSEGKANQAETGAFDDFFDSFQKQPDRLASKTDEERQRIKSAIFTKVAAAARPSRSIVPYKIIFRYAASLAAVGVALSAYFLFSYKQEFITYQNDLGERTEITLNDGSVVHLNAGSTLTVPAEFSSSNRSVKLLGEAFFEVEKDKSRPFIIESEKLLTTVVGTSFNVKSFPGERSEVSVISGKVRVALKEKSDASFLLNPGEQVVQWNDRFEKSAVDTTGLMSWTRGELFFNDVSMEEAAGMLERWYGVKVIFENPSIGRCYIKGTYEAEDIEPVLGSLSHILSIRYEFDGATVRFSGEANCH